MNNRSIDLVNIMTTEHGVKQRVEIIEQVDDLDGVTERGDGGETHDVTEVDGHLVKVLWLHGAPSLQSLGHRSVADRGWGGGEGDVRQVVQQRIGYHWHA